MSTPSEPRELPPQPTEPRRAASRGVAAAAVLVLVGGVALLGIESCAQTTPKPLQADPKPHPSSETPPTTPPTTPPVTAPEPPPAITDPPPPEPVRPPPEAPPEPPVT